MRFPRIHVATSVRNHILNAADNIPPVVRVTPAPNIPNGAQAGAAIDAAVSTPLATMAAPMDADAIAVGSTLEGGSSADALQVEGVLENMP